MTVVDFEERRKKKESQKHYDYIKSMCRLQRFDLFDKLISEQELTEMKITSCTEFVNSLIDLKLDVLGVFNVSLFSDEETFYDEYGINWYMAVDEALTFYAVLRRDNKTAYSEAVEKNSFL